MQPYTSHLQGQYAVSNTNASYGESVRGALGSPLKRTASPNSGNAPKRGRRSPGAAQGGRSPGHQPHYMMPDQLGVGPQQQRQQQGFSHQIQQGGQGNGNGTSRGSPGHPGRYAHPQTQLPNFGERAIPRSMGSQGRPPSLGSGGLGGGSNGNPQLVRPSPVHHTHQHHQQLSGVLPGKRTPQPGPGQPQPLHRQTPPASPSYQPTHTTTNQVQKQQLQRGQQPSPTTKQGGRTSPQQGGCSSPQPSTQRTTPRRSPSPSQRSPSRRSPSPSAFKAMENEIEAAIANILAPGRSVRELSTLLAKVQSVGIEAKLEGDDYTYVLPERGAPQFKCDLCGNMNQGNFVGDKKSGDTICMGPDNQGCGNVVQDRKVHEGSMYRKFEGEEDRSHHGPVPNNLYSPAHNMQTFITSGGPGSGTKDAGSLRRVSEMVEMNLSNMGEDKGDRRTRVGYKDQQKKKAFELMGHVAANLDLHDMVVEKAKEIFAVYRNVREHVHDFQAVIAACMIGAYREVGKMEKEAAEKRGEAAPLNPGMRPRSLTEEELHPFKCERCGARFNAKRAFVAHACARRASPTLTRDPKLPPLHPQAQGPFQGGGGNSAFRSSGTPKQDMSRSSVDTSFQKWDLKQALQWLSTLDDGKHKRFIPNFSNFLQKELQRRQASAGRGRGRLNQKRPPCAGQILCMITLHKITQVCDGDKESATTILKSIGIMKTEKSMLEKQEKEDKHFMQRQNQLEMKPWLKLRTDEGDDDEKPQSISLYSP